VIIGAPLAELTLVLLELPELLELPVTDAADFVELPVADKGLETIAPEPDLVVEAAVLVELATEPAVMVTIVLMRNISASDGLAKLVIKVVEKGLDDGL